MTTNQNTDTINKELTKDEREIFDKMVNYFELNPNNLGIQIPYNFRKALENIDNMTLDSFSSDLKEIVPNKEKKKFYYYDGIDFTLNNITFLTSKLTQNKKTEYILLNDLTDEGYIYKQEYDTGINLKIISREYDKKEIYIKCNVNYQKFTENIINNLINKSNLKKQKQF